MTEHGYVHVYYGTGKGKTTAAAGLALRCGSRGFKVGFTAFLKSFDSGEFLGTLPYRVIKSEGVTGFWKDFSEEKRKYVRKLSEEQLDDIFYMAEKEHYDMIVLDEILNAVEVGALSEAQLLTKLHDKPFCLEIVMTGRSVSAAILALADYATELKQIKHPYYDGIKARNGIEM